MATRKTPVEPEAFAAQMGDLPKATDRLRLVGLEHADRVQQGRLGATNRRLALTRARRADDVAEITRLEAAIETESRARRSYRLGAQTAEIEVPERTPETFVLHGRVFDTEGLPADQLTVAAVDADGSVRKFTCTDPKGYFRMDLPVKSAVQPRGGAAVFLQVSDADQAVLYRGEEAIQLAPGGVAYREIRLSGDRLPPCPIPPDRATMPKLLDRPESEAVAILARLGLKVAQRLTQTAPNRAGLVVSQEPAAGTAVTAETEVTLVIGVSDQGDTVTVPDVVGRPRDEAESRIKEAELTIGRITERPGDPPGHILAQDPKAGTRVSPGTAVMLVVSVKPREDRIEVPDLIGRKQTEAEDILREVGLSRGRVTFRDDLRVGTVLDHDPAAGKLVPKDTAVDLVIGRRPQVERTEVPNLVGRTLSGAKEILASAQLKLGRFTGPEDGKVAQQDPEAGKAVAVGTAVSVRLSGSITEPTPSDDFTGRVIRRMAEDRVFDTLGIPPRDLRERLLANRIMDARSAKRVVELEDGAIQEMFGLRNRNHARSFRRMLREAIDRL